MRGAPDPQLRPVFLHVEEHARNRAEVVAIRGPQAGLGYGVLNAVANRVANRLLEAGVGDETRVGVCFERSPDLLIALLAIFKCGASAVLLDPSWPDEARQRVLELAAPRLTLGPAGAEWTDLTVAPGIPENPGRAVALDTVAYWVSTSGSTGTPKAVGVTHRALVHRAMTHIAGYGIQPDDRSSWLSPPGASIFAVELWPYLVAGASVRVPPAGIPASAHDLRDWLTAERIDKAFVPMPIGEMLFALEWPPDAGLRLMTVGGDSVRRWPRSPLPFEVAVEYGSAEANGVSSTLVPRHDRWTSGHLPSGAAARRPPIGRPWPDVDIWVLDERMHPVPAGQLGELYVGGPELARGYLDAPAQTASRFLPHPWRSGERLYRTGDLVVRTSDGMLHHHGRVDTQLKILGQRAEPAEVEALLLEHPAVAAAAVAGRHDSHGTLCLVAYVVLDGETNTGDLFRLARRRLPSHLVPSLIMDLPELPRNAGGKVDRDRLPDPIWPVPAAVPGRADDVEEAVVAIWTDELGRAPSTRDDHFLNAGGDSFRASRLMDRIREELGVSLRLRDFFRDPTLDWLQRSIRAAQVSSDGHDTVLR